MGTSRFKTMVLGVPMLIMVLVLSACGSTNNQPTNTGGGGTGTPTAAKIQVGLVTDTGGLNDRGFNQLAHEGYEMAEAKYHFRDSIVQSPNTNPDYKAELEQAAQSNDLVIGVGFLMAQAIDTVAKEPQNANKKFALIDSTAAIDANGTPDTMIKNVVPLLFREEQAGCLAGVVAGQMEKDGKSEAPKLLGQNTIAAVGGISIPPVDHYIAGYKYCAAQVDPGVKVLVQYSNDFNDPTKCSAPADAFIKQKMADIIFQVAGGCGIGALNAAETDGVYGIGVDTDQGYLHPDSIITSATKHVDTAVFDIIDLTEQGNYPTDPINFPRFDLNNNGVGVAALGSAVPSDVQPVLSMYMTEIKNNTITIPDSCAPAQTCASS